jgi:hypothetical protein
MPEKLETAPHNVFDDAPGPSPWYLTPTTRTVKGFGWRSAGNAAGAAGKTLLIGADGPVAILDFYHYVMMLDDSSLLIWHQGQTAVAPTAPVRLFVVQPNELSPLGDDIAFLYEKMKNETIPMILGGNPSAEMSLMTSVATEELTAEFPGPLQSVNELLILCKSSAIDAVSVEERLNLALLVAQPRQSTYRLYPQDWFNLGVWDVGYQWVTRVARHSATGRIHGEGSRIAPFVLDNSLRRLRQ